VVTRIRYVSSCVNSSFTVQPAGRPHAANNCQPCKCRRVDTFGKTWPVTGPIDTDIDRERPSGLASPNERLTV
jgi:hypothetical protein